MNLSICPSVDVIIPAYNPGKFLEEALISCALQSYKGPFSITVIDDGSSEDIRGIVEKIKARYMKPSIAISLITLPENRGVSSARNAGIKRTRGDIVVFQDADDFMNEKRLESSVAQFVRDPDLMFVCGNFQYILEGVLQPPRIATPIELDAKRLLIDMPIMCSSVSIRREALKKTGLFNEMYEVGEDYDLWVRFLKHFPKQVKYVHEVWYYYRRHATEHSLTKRYIGTARMLEIMVEIAAQGE